MAVCPKGCLSCLTPPGYQVSKQGEALGREGVKSPPSAPLLSPLPAPRVGPSLQTHSHDGMKHGSCHHLPPRELKSSCLGGGWVAETLGRCPLVPLKALSVPSLLHRAGLPQLGIQS